MSLIAVSCETPIYQERSCLVYVRNTCSIWYFIHFVHIAIFMSLHGPAGAYIPVVSASPIHVFPIQCVLKHRGAHKHIYIYVTCHAKKGLMRFFLEMHFIMHSCRAIFALFIVTYCVKIG